MSLAFIQAWNKILITDKKLQVFKFLKKISGWVICLFDLILYVPSTIFQLNRDGSSWVEPVLS